MFLISERLNSLKRTQMTSPGSVIEKLIFTAFFYVKNRIDNSFLSKIVGIDENDGGKRRCELFY